MAEPKTYLNVPYAQKDAAKALGARWDAVNKKWYVPPGKDIALFAQWQPETLSLTAASTASDQPLNRSAGRSQSAPGVVTQATIKDFVAYSGDEPPWD